MLMPRETCIKGQVALECRPQSEHLFLLTTAEVSLLQVATAGGQGWGQTQAPCPRPSILDEMKAWQELGTKRSFRREGGFRKMRPNLGLPLGPSRRLGPKPSGIESWAAARLVNPTCFAVCLRRYWVGSMGVLSSLHPALPLSCSRSAPPLGREVTAEGWAGAKAGPGADPRPHQMRGCHLSPAGVCMIEGSGRTYPEL